MDMRGFMGSESYMGAALEVVALVLNRNFLFEGRWEGTECRFQEWRAESVSLEEGNGRDVAVVCC